MIQRKSEARVAHEYGCDLRRLYPWPDAAEPSWGSAIASVCPGGSTEPHAHDESETFIVLSGSGRMEIASESELLEQGDVVLIPKNREHRFVNTSNTEALVFLTIYWDSPEARERLAQKLARGQHDL